MRALSQRVGGNQQPTFSFILRTRSQPVAIAAAAQTFSASPGRKGTTERDRIWKKGWCMIVVIQTAPAVRISRLPVAAAISAVTKLRTGRRRYTVLTRAATNGYDIR